jgi:hypothetical protein
MLGNDCAPDQSSRDRFQEIWPLNRASEDFDAVIKVIEQLCMDHMCQSVLIANISIILEQEISYNYSLIPKIRIILTKKNL